MGPPRQHPRFAHAAAVTIHAAGRAHVGRTTNLSRGGLCTDLAAPIPVGTDVVVDIALVFDQGKRSESLQLAARVVWSTSVDGTRQTGLAFHQVQPVQAEYLAVFLRYLDDRTHARRAPAASVDERFC